MKKQRKVHFEVPERKLMLRLGDIIIVLLTFFCWNGINNIVYFDDILTTPTYLIVFVFYINVVGSIFDIYNLKLASHYLPTIKMISFTVLSCGFLYLFTPLITPSIPNNRLHIFYFFLIIFTSILLWRIFYIKFLTKDFKFSKKSVLICEPGISETLIKSLNEVNPHDEIEAVLDLDPVLKRDKLGQLIILHNFEELKDFVKSQGIYQLIIGPNIKEDIILRSNLISFMENGTLIVDYAHVLETTSKKVPVNLIEKRFYHHFPISRSNSNQLYLRLVRLIEILFSLIALFCTIILFLPIVLCGNLIANRGPLFYKQERIGKNGFPFYIIKFRSMVTDAEKDGEAFAQKNDARITGFGKFLRKSRIDELPQLINVLKGNMGLIGPRPERRVFVEQIANEMSLYPIRHIIRPGLTGWAQINYSYGASIEDSIEKLRYDLYYIKYRSLFLDIKIVLKTINTVLFFRGQ